MKLYQVIFSGHSLLFSI